MQRKHTVSYFEGFKPTPKVLRICYGEVKGFGLRVTPAGHKSLVFQSTRDKVKVQATIGSAQCWNSEDARERARETRILHEDGKDARGMLKEGRKARALEELVKCWRKDYKPKREKNWKPCAQPWVPWRPSSSGGKSQSPAKARKERSPPRVGSKSYVHGGRR